LYFVIQKLDISLSSKNGGKVLKKQTDSENSDFWVDGLKSIGEAGLAGMLIGGIAFICGAIGDNDNQFREGEH
jgi:hypothetical protein